MTAESVLRPAPTMRRLAVGTFATYRVREATHQRAVGLARVEALLDGFRVLDVVSAVPQDDAPLNELDTWLVEVQVESRK